MPTLRRHRESQPSAGSPLAVAGCDNYGSSSDNGHPRTRPTIAPRSDSTSGCHAWPILDAPLANERTGASSPFSKRLPGDAFTNAVHYPVLSSDCNEPRPQEALSMNANDSQNDGRITQPLSFLRDECCAQSSWAETLNLDLTTAIEEDSVVMSQDVYERTSSAGAQPAPAGSARSSQGPPGRQRTSGSGLPPRPPRPAAPPHAAIDPLDGLSPFLNRPEPPGRDPTRPEPLEGARAQSASCSSSSNQPSFHGRRATAAATAAATAPTAGTAAAGASAVLHPGRHQNGDPDSRQPGSAPANNDWVAVFRPSLAPEPHCAQHQPAAPAPLRASLATSVASRAGESEALSPLGRFVAATGHPGRVVPSVSITCASRLTATATATTTAASGIYLGRPPLPSPSKLRNCWGCGSSAATARGGEQPEMPYFAQIDGSIAAAAARYSTTLQTPYLRPESPFDWGLQLPGWEEGPGDLVTLGTAHFEQRMEDMNQEAWIPGSPRYVFRPASMLGRWLPGNGGAAAATSDTGGHIDSLAAAAAAGRGPGHVAAKLVAAAATTALAAAPHAATAAAVADGPRVGHPSWVRAGVGQLRGIAMAASAGTPFSAHAGGSAAMAVGEAAAVAAAVADADTPAAGGGCGSSNGKDAAAQSRNAFDQVGPCYEPTSCTAVSELVSLDGISGPTTVGGLLATVARLAAEGAPCSDDGAAAAVANGAEVCFRRSPPLKRRLDDVAHCDESPPSSYPAIGIPLPIRRRELLLSAVEAQLRLRPLPPPQQQLMQEW
ncbi:hypothetical protein VOLCADRAFT_89654 [Volvox carteri f. nagariensis]|uniref:Uncharacterized protein n=1 Tax=Volvox carteri f. nagariensis TaxID=3068 RepID=D8TSF2_VOLCA|nr:uncharacterized protein VOLCADRAFT_89654 [Volvox carteri f. nagariensis]EFJ49687.1 hypothetical protein VOLCADRAFT_89654 [Volvox carteri f. nagariensis]|eukprot:XP_002949194.1 hypothetical protein VOLCADRAFT_89654 [Volvox carteri f. nagariensis]